MAKSKHQDTKITKADQGRAALTGSITHLIGDEVGILRLRLRAFKAFLVIFVPWWCIFLSRDQPTFAPSSPRAIFF